MQHLPLAVALHLRVLGEEPQVPRSLAAEVGKFGPFQISLVWCEAANRLGGSLCAPGKERQRKEHRTADVGARQYQEGPIHL